MAKKGKVKKQSPGRIDTIEQGNLFMFTLVYAIFVAILSGVSKVYLPEIVYLFNVVPIDVPQLVWILGLAIWGIITILLGIKYKRE